MNKMTIQVTPAKLKKELLHALDSTKFPLHKTRSNVSETASTSFALGTVNYRGGKQVNYKTRGPSRWNAKFPHLFEVAQQLIKICKPDFEYTTIQVNKNVECQPHVDKNNVGESYIIALGDYTGGELVIEGVAFNIKNRWKKFDGKNVHWVEPFQLPRENREANRYSLVYFTHSFKPPPHNLKNLTITKESISRNGEIIKKW